MVVAGTLAVAAPASSVARPSAPVVQGPRIVSDPVAVYQLRAREAGVPASRLRFRCALDVQPMRACRATLRLRLESGRHVLRVRAVDPAGRSGPETRVAITVLERTPSIRVGNEPVNVAFGLGSVWVANHADGTISRVDPASGQVTATITVGGGPGGVATGPDAVWVANFGDGSVERVDPDTNRVVGRTQLGGQPVGIVASGADVWVGNFDGSVERLDAATGVVRARVRVGGKCGAVLLASGRLWVGNADGTVATIDPATGAVAGSPIPVGVDTDALAAGADGIWVSTYESATVALVDPSSRTVVRSVHLPGRGGGVAVAAGSVWASVYDGAKVLRVDPAAARIVDSVVVGVQPREIAVGGGALWVVDQGSDAVSRIALP